MNPDQNPTIPTNFTRGWRNVFGETPPLGHILRQDFLESWTRFHALPNSKRYAETEDEYKIVLSRGNSLAVELFGRSKKLWIAAGFSEYSPHEDSEVMSRLNMQEVFQWIDKNEEPEYQFIYSFFVAQVHWKPRSIDWLFSIITDDKERAIIFDPTSGVTLAPYDGGFDIIGLQTKTIIHLEKKYSSWMSAESSRL